MPDLTPNLGLKKPLGNENVTRVAYNENLDLLDQNVAKSSDLTTHLADGVKHTTQAEKDAWNAKETPAGAQAKADVVQTNLTNHLEDLITDIDGVHGLKIESGTWTPVIKCLTVPGSHTYSSHVGSYYKIGKLVYISGYILITTKDVEMSGSVAIDGLPFVVASGNAFSSGIALGSYSNFTLDTNYQSLTLEARYNSTCIDMYEIYSGHQGTLPSSAINNSTILKFGGCYITS